MRGLHPLAAAGRDPQPVEPRLRGRRLLRRRRRGAGGGHDDARQRLGHRRLDPHPGHRSTASSASSRRTGGCRSTRRSTSTCTATRGPLARTVADCRAVSRTWSRARTRRTSRRCGRAIGCPSGFERRRGPAGRRVRRSRRLAGRPGDRARTRWPCGDALRAAGAAVDEVDLVVRARRGAARLVDPLPPRLRRAGSASEVAAHGELMTRLRARTCARRLGATRRGGTADGELRRSRPSCTRRSARCWSDYDALLCPTLATRGLVAGDDYVGHGLDRRRRRARLLLRRVTDARVQHHVPLPGARTCRRASPTTACPTGLQIVGRTYDDVTAFRVGAALERVRPWPTRRRRRATPLKAAS